MSAFRSPSRETTPTPPPLADQLRQLLDAHNLDDSAVAKLAGIELAAVRALLLGAGTWTSATALLRGLNRVGIGGTLKITAPRRDRKGSIRNLAATAGLAPDTVMACQQFVSNPYDDSLIKIASLEAYIKTVGGRIWIA